MNQRFFRTVRWTALLLVTAIGTELCAAEKVLMTPVPAGGKPMAAKTDAKGTIHVIFDTASGPQYAKSTDNGKSLGKPIELVDRAARQPGLEFNTWDVGVSPDGTVHVVMGTNAWKLKLPKDQWGYMYTRLLPDQKAFEPVRNINHIPSEGFSLAIGENGSVAAVWMADKLFANLSSDGGATFGPTIELDSNLNPCNCCTTSSVFAADGRVAILYREETNNERDMYLALWDTTTNKATKTRVSATGWKIDSCPMTYYSVARVDDGFVVAWPTKGDVYFARLTADGTPRAPREIKTPGACGMRTGIVALPTSKGNTLVAWKKDNKLGWQFYDEKGKPQGIPGSQDSLGSGVAVTTNSKGDVVVFR